MGEGVLSQSRQAPLPLTARSRCKLLLFIIRTTHDGRRIEVIAPLIALTKSQIIKLGIRFGVPYELTWSCYRGGARPCGRCDSCRLRREGFAAAGVPDPTRYA